MAKKVLLLCGDFTEDYETMVPFQAAAEGVHRDVLPAVPPSLDVNLASLKATLTRKPVPEEIPVQVNIQYVVEFYAR